MPNVEVQLNTWERMTLVGYITTLKGSPTFVVQAGSVVDKLVLNASEMELVEWKATEDGPSPYYSWKREKDVQWDIEMSAREWTWLEDQVKRNDQWQATPRMRDLLKKILGESTYDAVKAGGTPQHRERDRALG